MQYFQNIYKRKKNQQHHPALSSDFAWFFRRQSLTWLICGNLNGNGKIIQWHVFQEHFFFIMITLFPQVTNHISCMALTGQCLIFNRMIRKLMNWIERCSISTCAIKLQKSSQKQLTRILVVILIS